MKTAKDVMRPVEVLVSKKQSLLEAMREIQARDTTHAVVVEANERIAGIISLTDILDLLYKVGDSVLDHEVERHMQPNVIVVSPTDTIDEVLRTMGQSHVHQVIVVERLKPIGEISQRDLGDDILRRRAEKDEST